MDLVAGVVVVTRRHTWKKNEADVSSKLNVFFEKEKKKNGNRGKSKGTRWVTKVPPLPPPAAMVSFLSFCFFLKANPRLFLCWKGYREDMVEIVLRDERVISRFPNRPYADIPRKSWFSSSPFPSSILVFLIRLVD